MGVLGVDYFNSGTGALILSALGGGDKTVAQLLDANASPTRHQLKHWLKHLEDANSIEKASGTDWHNCTWSTV
jgi:hypothetical protein